MSRGFFLFYLYFFIIIWISLFGSWILDLVPPIAIGAIGIGS